MKMWLKTPLNRARDFRHGECMPNTPPLQVRNFIDQDIV